MKKFFLTLAAIMCCAMTTAVFTSCGGDDSGNSGGGGGEEDLTTPAAAVLTFSFTFNDETLNYFDMTAEYFDELGAIKSESITSKKWEKTVVSMLPAKLGVRLKATLKTDLDDDEIYSFKWLYAYTCMIVNKKGNSLGEYSKSINGVTGFPDRTGRHIKEKLANMSDGVVYALVYEVDSKGKKVESSW
ncbi:MAG: hypothetical protein IKZ62_01655 [Prevotella sp.]|nr:hypothetical protein [Prevotella sp.]